MNEDVVAIVGSRKRSARIAEAVTTTMESLDRNTLIVTGCCRSGVDMHVRDECDRLGFRLIVCVARWKARGQAAGPERNDVIARIAKRAYAFPEGSKRESSPGTWDCVDRFKSRNKPVDVRLVREVLS
jgi:hypothetical protein